MSITPLILGSGRAGKAIAKSLACLNLLRPELEIAAPIWLQRDSSLEEEGAKYTKPVLCIANPHGLHAQTIIRANQGGYAGILCEKPACVNLEQIRALRDITIPTAVLHVYRQMWGPQTLKQMVSENEFGDLICIEGRYWQASTAEQALLNKSKPAPKNWKDDVALAGEYDTYLDVASHWIDAVSFLYGSSPMRIQGWRSYSNANSPHRDSHVQVMLDFANGGRALGSVSKTLHGAPNHFEINVIGTKKSATWNFLNPDEILIGEGRKRSVLSRGHSDLGSMQPPYHGMGWLEGYIEIASRLITGINSGDRQTDYPRLSENLEILHQMLITDWQ